MKTRFTGNGTKFWWHAIAVLFKNASTARVLEYTPGFTPALSGIPCLILSQGVNLSDKRRREGSYCIAYRSSRVHHLPRDGKNFQLSISLFTSPSCFVANGIDGRVVTDFSNPSGRHQRVLIWLSLRYRWRFGDFL